MMSLQDAIEEVKWNPINWMAGDICWIQGRKAEAIATILNAVVKGELRCDNDR